MMNRTSPIRKHSRFPVRWPVLYSGEDFVGEGTVLDVTQSGWRLAGAMPVHPGMRLTLRLWPDEKAGEILIHNATVLWVKGCEFALDVPELHPADSAWLAQFLDHKLSRWLMHDFKTPASAVTPQADQSAAAEEMGKDGEESLDDRQTEVLALPILRHRDPSEAAPAKLQLAEHDVLRIARGIRALHTLRLRTGTDCLTQN